MKKYKLSFAESITHIPKHPERTCVRQGRGMDFDVTYMVCNSAAFMQNMLSKQSGALEANEWRAWGKK